MPLLICRFRIPSPATHSHLLALQLPPYPGLNASQGWLMPSVLPWLITVLHGPEGSLLQSLANTVLAVRPSIKGRRNCWPRRGDGGLRIISAILPATGG